MSRHADSLISRLLLSTQALQSVCEHCKGKAAEAALFPVVDARKTLRAINRAAQTHVQGHGLRATFASVAEGLVSAAVLNHLQATQVDQSGILMGVHPVWALKWTGGLAIPSLSKPLRVNTRNNPLNVQT